MIIELLFCVAAAIFITWLIIVFLKQRENAAQLKSLETKLSQSGLSFKKTTVKHQWVTLTKLNDEHFKDMDVSAVLVGDKIKLLVEPNNLTDLRTDFDLLRRMNEALHISNDDFGQRILSEIGND